MDKLIFIYPPNFVGDVKTYDDLKEKHDRNKLESS